MSDQGKTGERAHYLSAIRKRLEQLYDASADNPRLREQLSDEIDWIDEQLSAAAPPQPADSAERLALEKIIDIDTTISDGGKVHDHGPCAAIAIAALRSAPDTRSPPAETGRTPAAKE